ncbi:MAG TPA: RNA 2',3'-cyclic phosphodiesterase [Aggregicoccus sp.]|nr:RNA 2',3'-cyclic phosphodiesterase [Aggregicoccus sp.]
MRTFVAIELGAALGARLEVELRRGSRLAPQARWVRPHSLHLTLAFLGEVPDALAARTGEALAEVATRHAPHALRLRGSGTFGPLESPKVLWVGVGGALEALEALQRALVRALAPLGLAPDHGVFMPHVTLARAKGPRGDAALERCALALQGVDFGELPVREVALFMSQTDREGMRYSPLVTHGLSGREPLS